MSTKVLDLQIPPAEVKLIIEALTAYAPFYADPEGEKRIDELSTYLIAAYLTEEPEDKDIKALFE